ncbi:MoaD/ThiS family protein [Brachybacterium sp. UMB0905]|uniref:MoaD/ThiS family protein n=1 Tax=Brachybacterium sp. UMB0905 TaxID=2069310 RepID=UPI000C809070|nr:MoaD/ThiS family protein [Brachybacterium sp. UMB0905]PMC75571.1 molybdopterin synthase sulfur carrier subunit [Brachybacterium sp. UMB0905]
MTQTPAAAPETTAPQTAPAPTTAPLISVHLFAAAAAELGTAQTQVTGATVQGALENLLEGASDRARQVVERSSLLLNAVSCTDRERELADGDRLDVLPPFAGG